MFTSLLKLRSENVPQRQDSSLQDVVDVFVCVSNSLCAQATVSTLFACETLILIYY